MQKGDFKKFAECMIALQETFTPDKPISETKMELYFRLFKDISIEVFKEACFNVCQTKHISTFPLPAEIRDAITGNLDDQAILAYDKFTKGKAQTGVYQTVIFDDITIHAVIEAMGGWEAVCLIPEDEWKFKRKEFLDLYKAFKKNPRTDTPQKLIGLIEGHNLQAEDWRKYIGEPVYIGFEEKKVKQLEKQMEVLQ